MVNKSLTFLNLKGLYIGNRGLEIITSYFIPFLEKKNNECSFLQSINLSLNDFKKFIDHNLPKAPEIVPWLNELIQAMPHIKEINLSDNENIGD